MKIREKTKKFLKKHKKLLFVCLSVLLLGLLFVIISNVLIVQAGRKKLVPDAELQSLDADCILILGAGIREGNRPSPVLEDRLNEGLRLYQAGMAPKLLVSGDHGRTEYDEVNVMKAYLMEAGVPSEDIFMDHAGFSTYESMYRARHIFGVEKLIVVTQEFHQYRALYICEQLGMEAYGAPSDPRRYMSAGFYNFRECLARDKDIFTCLFRVKPTFLGDPIDIHGSGDVTND